ncbi:hypothetical protein CBR_g22367 [Chara braunii]|uniref:Ribosomal L1 domain-containing protein 1 n=1 Tax=Chara braunii TaxID=69332 RepID=A0A388JUW7_CHABU|nr:hypothetical protein CBR_g22367 [Chara braunii]|eukprot:GBG61570.1 hypothetical protein CBR_g22367 [Chara braunii]
MINSGETVHSAVKAAVKSLRTWLGKNRDDMKQQLLGEDDLFYVHLVLKKVPDSTKMGPRAIELPYPLYAGEAREVCLFLKDKDDAEYKANKEKVKQDRSTGVTKIMGLSKVRTNYKSFESRRQLCNSYDLFLADDRIVDALSKLVGKAFFKSKKKPIAVRLRGKNWIDEIHKVKRQTHYYMAGGACLSIKAARTTFEEEQVEENVMTVIRAAARAVHGKWQNVQAIYLKTKESAALPVYNSLPDIPLKISSGLDTSKPRETSKASGAPAADPKTKKTKRKIKKRHSRVTSDVGGSGKKKRRLSEQAKEVK